jgi:hypothetical protein
MSWLIIEKIFKYLSNNFESKCRAIQLSFVPDVDMNIINKKINIFILSSNVSTFRNLFPNVKLIILSQNVE